MIGAENMENLKVELPNDLREATKAMISDSLDSAVRDIQAKNSFPPYLNKGEASAYWVYQGVSLTNGWRNTTSPQSRLRA